MPRASPPPSIFVEVQDCGIIQILLFSGIDDDDFPWRAIKVRYVDVPVLDHGSKGGFDDGLIELVFDLMEFGVAHAEALLFYSIIFIHQARQHCSIRGIGHLHDPLKLGVVLGSRWALESNSSPVVEPV